MSRAPTSVPGGTMASIRSRVSSASGVSAPAGGAWQGPPGVLGEGDERLDGVEPPLVAQVPEPVAGPPRVGLLPLAVAAGEQALRERAPDQGAHAVALADRQDLALDRAVEDRGR